MNLKPIFHFMPEKNWMNDPNGPIYYKGEYHLFYQHNPNDYHWDTMHWGHAKSKNLVNWEHLPIALYPSNELEELHCYSGCCVISDEGVPTIFYTSIGEGRKNQITGAEQWIATSHDNMMSWEKHPDNPVMKLELHGELDVKEWRDPFIWKENGGWFMVIGGAINNVGCVLIYKSKDLLKWEFLNVLYKSEKYKFIECPNIIKFRDKYVLVFSPDDVVTYLIGTINDEFEFQVEKENKLDFSGWEGFYAPNSLEGPEGRKIMWGWLTEKARGEDSQLGKGWSGTQSIPRILSLDSNNVLIQKPAEELQKLRKNEVSFSNLNINGAFNPAVKGRALEILAEVQLECLDTEFTFNLFASEDREEETLVKISPFKGNFSVDRTKSSLAESTHKTELVGKADFKVGKTLKLNIFIDHSTIEVFLNDRETLSTRIYPTREDSDNILVIVPKGEVKFNSLRIWEMKEI